ncbi:30S ribosomal protein S8 [Patescibacteria group bacterium]|nr:30S ribosomal protein S8 [Patescibacteria group bacterium]
MTDPIADMLTRIRNASLVNKKEVIIPMSDVKKKLLEVMLRERYIQKVEVLEADPEAKDESRFARLKVLLKYVDDKPFIMALKRVSKPGLRKYVTKQRVPVVLNGRGIAIMSTELGIITNKEARRNKLGGEVICEIY